MSEQFDPQDVFTDPVAYLRRLGVEVVVVDQVIVRPEAA